MTGPDMRIAADRFYDGTHLYDIRLVSTLGFSDFQVDSVAAVEGVSAVMPAKSTDVMAQINEEQYAARVSTLPIKALDASYTEDGCTIISDDDGYLNRLLLEEGRWPEKAGECVISADRVSGVPIGIGDSFEVLYGSTDLEDVLDVRSYTIVGTAHSSSFVSSVTMGATSLGNGSIQQFAYVAPENFVEDYPYSEIFVEVEGARELFSSSDEYDDYVGVVVSAFEDKADDLALQRLSALRVEAQDKLDEEVETFDKEKFDAFKELNDAQRELDDAKIEIDKNQAKIDDAEKEIADGREELESGRAELEDGFAELERQRQEAYDKLSDALKILNEQQAQYDKGLAELESKRGDVDAWANKRKELLAQRDQAYSGLAQAEGGLAEIQAGLSQIEAQLAALPADNPVRAQLEAERAALQEKQTEVQTQAQQARAGIEQLEAGIAQGDAGIEEYNRGVTELTNAKAQLDAAWSEYNTQEQNANTQLLEAEQKLLDAQREIEENEAKLVDAQQELDDGKKELEDGKKEYADGLAEYQEEREKALKEIDDAQKEIDDAQKDIDELEKPDIYVLDRSKNYGVSSQIADSERIDNIGRVFPFIFFLVAALVALTTMTRMVEEERGLIGTFKALGYSRTRITLRYLVYAGVASIVGAAFGLAVLSQVLPFVIARAYAIIYNIPSYPLPLPFDWNLGLLAGGLGVGVTLLATFFSVATTLREQPAQLMLPRAPKAGKRILVERIGPLWSRLSFSWKVTLRNLFRYKKRLFMTVIGIAGCTALLLTGWGLHDSIWDIIDKQYGPVINYNVIVKLDEDADTQRVDEVEDFMEREGDTQDITRVQSSNMQIASTAHDTLGVEVVVPSDPDAFAKLLTMKERIGQIPIPFDETSVVLTEKLARTLEVAVGDSFRLYKQDDIGNPIGAGYELQVTGIMENYIGNWAYLGSQAYEDGTHMRCTYNTLYGRCTEDMDKRLVFTEGLHNIDGVQTVSYNDETIDSYRTMLTSVDMIVVVLVVSAAALAFIVLYNLTNINITERRREIASLKVLGFTKREVYAYIFREIMLLVLIGSVFGLLLGTYLESFVCVTAEVDYVMFGRDIHLTSYLISFAMTLLFAFLVTLFMRNKLSGIDMVESLKSVD